MKATYTRKKLLNSLYPEDQVNRTSAQTEDSVADDDTGHDSMDVAPRSRIGSGIQSEDNSIMLEGNTPMTLNDSARVANAVNKQLWQDIANTDKDISEGKNKLYDVEYFIADDDKMVIPRLLILCLSFNQNSETG